MEAAEGGVEDVAFHFAESVFFDLTNAFASDGEFLADFFEGSFALIVEVESFDDDFFFFFGKKEKKIFDDLVNLSDGFDHGSLGALKHTIK